MHDKSASFVKGNGFRLLQDGGGVGSVKLITQDICGIILYNVDLGQQKKGSNNERTEDIARDVAYDIFSHT